MARHPAGLEKRPVKGQMKLLIGSTAVTHIGRDTVTLGRGLTRLKSIAREEGSPDRINSHVSMIKASLQVEGYQL